MSNELDQFNQDEMRYALTNNPSWTDKALPMEGRATFLPFRDTVPGSVMNQREWALPGVVAGALNAFTAPGRAYSGSDTTFNPNEEAANFALNTMGGGLGLSRAAPIPEGSLGIFAGKNALNANQSALALMEKQLSEGVKPKAAWKETGWHVGKDQEPRWEIPDLESSLVVDPKDAATHGYKDWLFRVLDHPELYENYPFLKDMPVEFRNDLGKNVAGQLSPQGIQISSHLTPDDQRLSLLHEIQHAVQNYEKFSPGSNPSEKGVGAYKHSYGEAEARMVEDRADALYSQLEKDFPHSSAYFKRSTGVPLEKTVAEAPSDILGLYRSERPKSLTVEELVKKGHRAEDMLTRQNAEGLTLAQIRDINSKFPKVRATEGMTQGDLYNQILNQHPNLAAQDTVLSGVANLLNLKGHQVPRADKDLFRLIPDSHAKGGRVSFADNLDTMRYELGQRQ